MNVAVRNIAWKEVRHQWPTWIMFFSVGIVLLLWICFGSNTRMDSIKFAALFTAIYSVVASAVSFAIERELATEQLLKILPLRKRDLFIGKIATVTAAALLFFVLLFAIAFIVPMCFASYVEPLGMKTVLSLTLIPFEFLAWGFLFTFICRKPLIAAIAATTCSFVFMALMVGVLAPGYTSFSEQAFSKLFPYRIVVWCCLVGAITCLGRYWLQPVARSNSLETLHNRKLTKMEFSTSSKILRTLLIQSILRNAWFLIGAPLIFTVWLLIVATNPAYYGSFATAVFVNLTASTVVGFLVFRSDNTQCNYRFFSQQGEYPAAIWFSRIVIWLPVIILFSIVTLLFAWWIDPKSVLTALRLDFYDLSVPWSNFAIIETFARLLSVGILAFAAGQLCSMYFRSWPLALGSTALGGFAVFFFAWLVFDLDLPLWLTLWPLSLALLAASWLRTYGWLTDQVSTKRFVRPLIPVALVAIVVAAAIPTYRYCTIGGFGRSELLAELEGYKQTVAANDEKLMTVMSTIGLLGIGLPYKESFPQSDPRVNDVELIIEALSKKGMFRSKSSRDYRPTSRSYSSSIYNYLHVKSNFLKSNGDLKGSLDCLIQYYRINLNFEVLEQVPERYELVDYWLRDPSQTHETIDYAIQELQTLFKDEPTLTERVRQAILLNWIRSIRRKPFASLTTKVSNTPYLPCEESVYFNMGESVTELVGLHWEEVEKQIAKREKIDLAGFELTALTSPGKLRQMRQILDKYFNIWLGRVLQSELNRRLQQQLILAELQIVSQMLKSGEYSEVGERYLDPFNGYPFIFSTTGEEYPVEFRHSRHVHSKYSWIRETNVPYLASFSNAAVGRKIENRSSRRGRISKYVVFENSTTGSGRNWRLIELPDPLLYYVNQK